MSSVNKVFLMGEISKPPQVRDKGATLSIVTSEERDGKTYKTFHTIAVVGKGVGACKSLREGDTIFVDGKIQNRSYEDKDGNKTWKTEILCFGVEKMGGKESVTPPKEENDQPPDDSHIPF